MRNLAESLQNLPTTTGHGAPASSIGTVLGRIGHGGPLTVSERLCDLRPADTEHRLVAALQQCSGRLPVFQTRTYFPNDGAAYSLVEQVRWDCPREKLPEVVNLIEGAFKAAPADRLANELYKLRMLTRGREQRDAADQEAENVIWLEQLRCCPGDIVVDVLRSWPKRKDGQWWPTWHDVQAELQQRCDRRQALLNFVRRLAERPDDTLALTDQPPTAEQRARAVEHWEKEVRPTLAQKEEAKPGKPAETAEEALSRLRAKANEPVVIGSELAAKLFAMKQETQGTVS